MQSHVVCAHRAGLFSGILTAGEHTRMATSGKAMFTTAAIAINVVHFEFEQVLSKKSKKKTKFV
jgi:hypothetical protein